MRHAKQRSFTTSQETSSPMNIDAEARKYWSMNFKIVLDPRECLSQAFIDADQQGLVEQDSLGFLWYPMSNDEVTARDTSLASLERIWLVQ
jgi:hypothetical protein